jgi:hypothetical protein
MLTEQTPDEQLVSFAKDYVKLPFDRPWFYIKPPMELVECYQPKCRCSKIVSLKKFECDNNCGWVFLGQCLYCETIIWSYKNMGNL